MAGGRVHLFDHLEEAIAFHERGKS
jgi:hypothetical protein